MKEKIAIALEGEEVSQHFGHTTQFCVIELEAGKANQTGNISLQDGDCHSIPVFLHQNQINKLVVGGIGQGAVERLQEANIGVICGAQGSLSETIEALEKNSLHSTESICSGHEHGEGGCHH
ncbi:MAG: NifB/NifX family molybdenum-iron cluster-binding protein [Caldisericia bacterium]|nr:NifB/NifX family molybdenum-iron cluster-binding protein [Caldisericia bacterium]